MHKVAFATILLASLALPGCIFAVGTDTWDDGATAGCCGDCPQMHHAEKRLSALEHHAKGDCKAGCVMCEKPEAKADAKPATP
jgi:hypothetical protein